MGWMTRNHIHNPHNVWPGGTGMEFKFKSPRLKWRCSSYPLVNVNKKLRKDRTMFFWAKSTNFLWQFAIAIYIYVSLPEGSHVYHVYHGSFFFGYPIQDLWVCWSFRMEHPPVGESKKGKDNVGLDSLSKLKYDLKLL